MRFRCGSVAVPVNWNFVVISPFFAMFKNVVHSLEPSETPNLLKTSTVSTYVHLICSKKNTILVIFHHHLLQHFVWFTCLILARVIKKSTHSFGQNINWCYFSTLESQFHWLLLSVRFELALITVRQRSSMKSGISDDCMNNYFATYTTNAK